MALVVCSECGAQISSEAVSCPKCGKPMVDYELRMKTPKAGESSAGNFFRILAVFTWIGGFITAIVFGIANAGYRADFNWQIFFTITGIYVLSGYLIKCIGLVVDYIYGIYHAVTNLKLVYAKKGQPEEPQDAKQQGNQHKQQDEHENSEKTKDIFQYRYDND